MIIIDSPSNDAYFNIATEEYLLTKYPKEDILLFYINDPSIIIGKFQNTLAEINVDFVNENNIKVVRRMSGGGAVYHDLGNLNFSFHTLLKDKDFSDFSMFTQPVIQLLNKLNIPAKLEGRNDLLVDGKKFSGNAKLVKSAKMIQHGTILIDSEMDVLANALKANPLKFVDKAVKSNRSRVTNLIEYLPNNTSTIGFKELFIKEIEAENEQTIIYYLSAQDIENINKLVENKYATWEWNYGFSPAYNFKKAKKVAAGFIEVHMDVQAGHIKNIKIFGDFFASKPIEELEQKLLGTKHEENNIRIILEREPITEFFGKVNIDEIIDIFK